MKCKTIGVVGGMGPYADLDLMRKIRILTGAKKDQMHIPVVLVSFPDKIVDRSEFIVGHVKENPAEGIFLAAKAAVNAGAKILAIPCATAHSPKILNRFMELSNGQRLKFQFVHLIKSIAEYISKNYPAKKVGILSTYGAYLGGAYDIFGDYGIDYVFPDEKIVRDVLHPAIYHEEYGIKANPTDISDFAKTNITIAMKDLADKDVEVIVLGCTEIPLAIKEERIKNIHIVDVNRVLALKILEKCRMD